MYVRRNTKGNDPDNNGPNKKRKEGVGSEQLDVKDGSQLQRYVQILGTDSSDCCPSILVVTEACRIVFNAGDAQRLCSQYQVRLNKLEHLFLTELHADTLGGLLGMYLTLSDSGVKKLSVHGPRGVTHFLRSGGRPESELVPVEIPSGDVQPVVLDHVSILPLPTSEVEKSERVEGVKEESDGEGEEADGKKKRNFVPSSTLAVSYLLRFADEAGRMDVNKALSLGVPKGPLLGQLKAGKSVTLTCGTIVEPQDCVEDAVEGPLIGIWFCPDVSSITKLAERMKVGEVPPPPLKSPHTSKPKKKKLALVIHMSSNHILLHETYKQLVEEFCENDAKHVILNSHTQIICQLNKVSPVFFPIPKDSEKKVEQRMQALDQIKRCDWSTSDVNKNLWPASIMLKFGIKPAKYSGLYHYDPSVQLKSVSTEIDDEIICKQTTAATNIPPSLQSISRQSAEVLILGTAASLPGKYRNVSAIFVDLFDRGGILLDCGEGTLGQLARFYGDEELREIIAKTKCVWISHMHADHHLGELL
ncbi:hypothetical protein GUITHDRAFT_113844 [Guillardia theta CCMP2712]|uniref:ribonuclease Z n=1 Tax=Guillardia theta (strain CCMP2712) TaxID=905079 RepID=L1IV18_GUITC|nr:hypothetical protein GUITHDRAFT_113844 [Guillardia theta CCMP2712]EKX40106.1 hypothetical protein GUITHDRAFT_113844 [Guillardia theta CCMP2712]|eukprot:XP_005827086.1 hypothetical protein GUITHDRAFT_113844 [Guillardia theta CCMP2712]